MVSKQVVIMKLQHVTWQLRSCRLRSLINLRFEWQQGLRTGRGGSGSAPPPPMPLSCPLLPCSLPCCPVPSLAAPHPPVSFLAAPHPSVPSFAAHIPPFPLFLPPIPLFPSLLSLRATNTTIQKCCKLICILCTFHFSLLGRVAQKKC